MNENTNITTDNANQSGAVVTDTQNSNVETQTEEGQVTTEKTYSQAEVDMLLQQEADRRVTAALKKQADKFAKEKAEATLPKIDSKIETLATWLNYYKSEVAKIKSEMSEGRFRYNISGLEINNAENAVIKENHEKYLTLINSTMKNLSKTCVDLVAFY